MLIMHKKHTADDTLYLLFKIELFLNVLSSFGYFNVMGNQKHPWVFNNSLCLENVFEVFMFYIHF